MSNTEAGSPAPGIRVVIVDDHAIFRSGLKADLDPDIVVAGEAGTVEDAVAVIAAVRPDVVLLDVHLPGGLGGGGREVLAGSAPLLGSTRFLALSVSDAAEDVVSVIRAGARGYVTKTISGARNFRRRPPRRRRRRRLLAAAGGFRAGRLRHRPGGRRRTTSWTGCPPANSR